MYTCAHLAACTTPAVHQSAAGGTHASRRPSGSSVPPYSPLCCTQVPLFRDLIKYHGTFSYDHVEQCRANRRAGARPRPLRVRAARRMDGTGAPEEAEHFELADWRWDPHSLVRSAAAVTVPCATAAAAFDVLTLPAPRCTPWQVAELASGATSAPAASAEAAQSPRTAAAPRRASPPASLHCQVPSCSLPLDGLRVYNQRSRCGRAAARVRELLGPRSFLQRRTRRRAAAVPGNGAARSCPCSARSDVVARATAAVCSWHRKWNAALTGSYVAAPTQAVLGAHASGGGADCGRLARAVLSKVRRRALQAPICVLTVLAGATACSL